MKVTLLAALALGCFIDGFVGVVARVIMGVLVIVVFMVKVSEDSKWQVFAAR